MQYGNDIVVVIKEEETMMKKLREKVDLLARVATGSKRYEFEGSELTLSDYFTGEEVMVDMSILAGLLGELLDEGDTEMVEMILCAYKDNE